MKTPPAEMTSGMLARETEVAVAGREDDGDAGGDGGRDRRRQRLIRRRSAARTAMLLPQLHVMMSGLSPTAALNAPMMLTKLIFTGSRSMSGATAKMFADSPVPCPLSSSSGLAAAGPSTTGAAR